MKRKYTNPNLWTMTLATDDVLKVSAGLMEGANWDGTGFYFTDFFD